jgi:hypothetical protein
MEANYRRHSTGHFRQKAKSRLSQSIRCILQPSRATNKSKIIMFILKSILNQAGAVWLVETIAMRKKDAERLLARRQKNNDGTRRYGLFPENG